MENSTLITGAVVIAGLALLASETFASYGSGSQTGFGGGMIRGQGFARSNSGAISSNYATYGANIKREVKNIASGVEVTMTSEDPATLAHIKSMITQNAAKTPNNALIKIERTELPNGVKMTTTSTDPATVKSIQDRANNAKSGMFGNGGQGKGGMMKGKGIGKGNGNGQGRGGCSLNQ